MDSMSDLYFKETLGAQGRKRDKEIEAIKPFQMEEICNPIHECENYYSRCE